MRRYSGVPNTCKCGVILRDGQKICHNCKIEIEKKVTDTFQGE